MERLIINKEEREACDVHLTSEEITHLAEASSSEQHSEELSEQPSELISQLPFDELDEVLIKVAAEVGSDLQEDPAKFPSEKLSPKPPPVFEELADPFYHRAWLETIPDKRAETIYEVFLRRILLEWGPPRVVLTDSGSEFGNVLLKELCRLWRVKLCYTPPLHPQSNYTDEFDSCYEHVRGGAYP